MSKPSERALLTVKESNIYGKGCFALTHFPARKKIKLYEGELIKGSRKIQARIRRQAETAVKIITIDEETAIDGAVGGNETAFINHSCDPNAFIRILPGQKVAVFARRDIRPGEELTIDYRDPDHPEVCRCGATNCRSHPERSNKEQGRAEARDDSAHAQKMAEFRARAERISRELEGREYSDSAELLREDRAR